MSIGHLRGASGDGGDTHLPQRNRVQLTLDDDDWTIWQDVDPTVEDIETFFKSINTGLGTNPGNSRAQRRSSKPTRRR